MKRLRWWLRYLDMLIWPIALMLWIHTEENRGLLEFYSSDNFVGERMLVVIPFANDIEMVEKNIARWHHYEASSTKFPVNRYVDLLFYYHRDLQDVREIKERVNGLVKSVKSLKYFNNVFVLSAHLNQWKILTLWVPQRCSSN